MVFRDVSATRAMSLQMSRLAGHDSLTELPNRMLLHDRLAQAIASARRHGHHLAVLFLDLDRFKHVNDSLGHDIGDRLLQSVAARLATCIRRSDTVSRQGGDEFVILLSEVERADDAAVVAQKVIAAVAAPHAVLPTRTTVESIPRPSGTNGIWLYFNGGRYYSAGAAVPFSPDRFTLVGQHEGFPVYRDKNGNANEIWVAVINGGGPVAPYLREAK